ncbi:ThiF family adenylyltransferase [Nonomuraea sp. NPDC049269]|uniref:ThiF family adenylyltransferase n=1 Tax=Nonomuraea sp. NPDC049269 TaxID=3364349 RepID=UPI003719F0E2
MRPRVKPALRRIVRDEQTLQLGAHPLRSVLVTGSEHQWVAGLDGTRDLGQVLHDGAAVGLGEAACRALLDRLAERGVLDDAAVPPVRLSLGERDRLAPDLDVLDLAGGGAEVFARRRRARVRVHGAGRVGAQVVGLLAASGIGAIRVFDEGPVRPCDLAPGGLTWSELGMSRQDGAVALARRLTSGGPPPQDTPAGDSAIPGTALMPATNAQAGGPYLGDGYDRPDLVVLAPVAPLDGVLVNELTALGIPHLLVSAFEGHGSVGPLVLPGESACLHCLDLTRRDADPGWPIVTARLGGYPPGEIACDTTMATLVAASATGHALAHLDGRDPVVTNGTLDIMPDWRWKTRSWTQHPQCRCMRNHPYRPEWSCQSPAMGTDDGSGEPRRGEAVSQPGCRASV